ncbi:MAG: hypothetical protein ABI039_13885 [Vicinamibacterales bacterium]
MIQSAAAPRRTRPAASETRTCILLLVVGFAVCFLAVKQYRSAGQQPQFYQENFAPAVMMACGYGFTAPPAHSSPPSLADFLLLRTAQFRCEDFPTDLVPAQVTWNGTWYYLYGTVAAIWRVTGISWPALDGLAAALGALELLAFYGLFRLIASRRVAVVSAMLMLVAPFNLAQLMYLRDFSKAPFVLGSVFILGWLILRPAGRWPTIALAAAFGAVVGLGYGFRSDLIVMVPFGVVMVLFFLPGPLRSMWRRNLAAAAAAFAAFLIVGWPPLQGQRTGGCQFHYALLGLTSPVTDQMNVLSPMYAFGNHFLDTFVDLKVGDYAQRVLAAEPPNLCAPEYDRASGELFTHIATTFPADIVTHAYGSVLAILRSALPVSLVEKLVGWIPWAYLVARPIDRLLNAAGMLMPAVALAAVAVAWSIGPRLGIALTAFILFLTGYPAIEFEARHWFHLRFLPLWAGLAVWTAWVNGRSRWTMAAVTRGVAPVVITLLLMAAAVWTLRAIQRPRVDALIGSYLSAPVEELPTTTGPASVQVDWASALFGVPSSRRATDMLVVTVAPDGCGVTGPVDLVIRYQAPHIAHNLTSTLRVQRAAAGPTQVFFPVFSLSEFDRTLLRFTGIEAQGGPVDCITRVARMTERRMPLWMQVQVPPDWHDRPYYQSLRYPRLLRFLE